MTQHHLLIGKYDMAITGLVQRPDLLAQASTAIDDRTRMNKIANDCVEAAGAYSRANLGTALHAITEQIDLGLKPAILPGLQADIDAYVAGIAAYGIKMHDEFIEVLLINDDLEYAGTADRIVTLMDGRLVIFDLKTGTDLSYSFGNIAVQLAMYANADWMYNWKTGERTPMPAIDKTVGYHLPPPSRRRNRCLPRSQPGSQDGKQHNNHSPPVNGANAKTYSSPTHSVTNHEP